MLRGSFAVTDTERHSSIVPRRELAEPSYALCAECRTLLPVGSRCFVRASHRVYPLSDAASERELLRRVWRLPPAPVLHAARMGLLLGFVLATLLTRRHGPVVWLGSTLLAMWAGFTLGRFLRKRALRRSPRGASVRPRFPRLDTVARGVVSEGALVELPDLEAAVASLVVLKLSPERGGGVTLRHGISHGFEVRLDDGRQVHIGCGPIWLDAPPACRVDLESADRYRAHFIPRPGDAGGKDPCPYDGGYALLVRPGDRVQLRGKLCEPGTDSGYRELPEPWQFSGVPRVRLLPPSE